MLVADKFLRAELVDIYEEEDDQAVFFSHLSAKLLELGYVDEEYLHALLKREAEYPTGLKTATLNVAIPHTDPQYIKQPFIYIIKLKTPVTFGEMGTDNVFLKAEYAFCLGFDKGEDQLVLLQNLMAMFMDQLFMERLEIETDKKKMFDLVINYFNKEEE
ncbi:PTS sugar transporter subunit IIA [Enterococcus wangshanyuanii]|uniref:PTS sugar transporter subunit IIA n=1 Tax=Enterococcus wangshanyuanii TaxID=2005703 RepID=A0ABQ1P9F1_9ENTE|nr:PTS sugar transporter subunit IIA [Enterococcus wangshanyuanii]GGC93806.1 PTS sugar transporter subunit IIA [Enterococcus wangshanyuanii]